jgi:predicted nucleotidyltransferase
MNIKELRDKYRDKILEAARECGISSVKVFGSAARNEATDKSDIDFLISTDKGVDLLSIGQFHYEMEDLLQTKVDIAFEGHVHPCIADRVMKEAVLL